MSKTQSCGRSGGKDQSAKVRVARLDQTSRDEWKAVKINHETQRQLPSKGNRVVVECLYVLFYLNFSLKELNLKNGGTQ